MCSTLFLVKPSASVSEVFLLNIDLIDWLIGWLVIYPFLASPIRTIKHEGAAAPGILQRIMILIVNHFSIEFKKPRRHVPFWTQACCIRLLYLIENYLDAIKIRRVLPVLYGLCSGCFMRVYPHHRTTTALDNHLNRTAVKPKFRQLKNVTQISFSYANNNNVLLPTDNSVSHVGPSMWFPLILIAYQSLLMYINHYLTYYT